LLSSPLGALGATHTVHLSLIGKRLVLFLLVIFFLLSVMAEALRVKID